MKILTFILMFLSAINARAAVTVHGKVTDEEGGAVARAQVLFVSKAGGDTTTAVTGGRGSYSVEIQLFPSGVKQQYAAPDKFHLGQNYPNPFNPSTIIALSLPKSVHAHLAVYNILGRRVKTLINGVLPAGEIRVAWDGTDDFGASAPAGLYLYRFQADEFTAPKKMLLIDGSATTSGPAPERFTSLSKAASEVAFQVLVKKEAFSTVVDENFILSSEQTDVEKEITIPVLSRIIAIDKNTTCQIIDGFGGYGGFAQWKNRPEFVDLVVNDLGLSIVRTNIPPTLESVNDDDDPHHFNWDAFRFYNDGGDGEFPGDRIDYLKSLQAAGDVKIISTVWSPPGWMKKSGQASGKREAAPDPETTDCALIDDMMDEFAELIVAYIKLMKQEADLDIYAVSLQNEPAFEEPYHSCVYSPEKLRDLVKTVGRRFQEEDIGAMIFAAEDLGWHDRVMRFINANMDDPEARQYIGRNAVHGYALDGKTGRGWQASQWQELYQAGAQHGIPLWMTETSGYANDYDGAMQLAQAIHFGLYYGKISAWVWWTLSVSKGNPDSHPYGLILGLDEKTVRYYASKHFYKFIRPGMQQIASSSFDRDILVVAFQHPENGRTTIVLINRGDTTKAFSLHADGLPTEYEMYRTSARERCRRVGSISISEPLSLWSNSIVTLVHDN